MPDIESTCEGAEVRVSALLSEWRFGCYGGLYRSVGVHKCMKNARACQPREEQSVYQIAGIQPNI